MRNAFRDALIDLADKDPKIVLLAADIGNRMFDEFKERFPGRFYNCGVAEQNMTGVAAGLAMTGFRPFTYTITPFVTSRCLEQIRVDLCYHELPVVVVAVGAGYAYASLGATHHACEDISFMRSLPGMQVVCPGDSWEVKAATEWLGRCTGPSYLRLGKKNEPLVHQDIPSSFALGRALVLQPGKTVALLSTGNLLPEAVEAGKRLGEAGISSEVVSFHTVKPLDLEYLSQAFDRFSLVVTLEEHSRIGGLGGAISEWICAQEKYPKARLVSLGTPDAFPHEAGDQHYFREKIGLNGHQIAAHIQTVLGSMGIAGKSEGSCRE